MKYFEDWSKPLHILQALLRGGVNIQSLTNVGQKPVEIARFCDNAAVVDTVDKPRLGAAYQLRFLLLFK